MNTATSKILRALVIVVVLVFFASKIYNSFKDKVETEEAVSYSVNENITFDGVFVRNEEVVVHQVNGVIDYVYEDGSKLSKNSVIANVYESESQIYAKQKIKELEKELSNLEHSQNPGTTNYAKPETIKAQIDEKYMILANEIEKQNLDAARETKSEITVLLNIYNIVTQIESDYSEREAELQSMIEMYQSQYALPVSIISTDHTGYFVSTTDGYESAVNMDNLNSASSDLIESIINGEGAVKTENAIGKIFDSYECKIAGIIKPTNKFLKGDTLKIRLGSSEQTYSVTVDEIIKESEDKWILILDCNAIDSEISRCRVEKIELIFQEYTGLKVPRDAIKFKEITETVTDENGNKTEVTTKYKGVYVQIGQDITFKKIDVIYEGDNFVISENVSDTDYLNLYDQIVMEEVEKKDVSG